MVRKGLNIGYINGRRGPFACEDTLTTTIMVNRRIMASMISIDALPVV